MGSGGEIEPVASQVVRTKGVHHEKEHVPGAGPGRFSAAGRDQAEEGKKQEGSPGMNKPLLPPCNGTG